jgi:hypothetical protein
MRRKEIHMAQEGNKKKHGNQKTYTPSMQFWVLF